MRLCSYLGGAGGSGGGSGMANVRKNYLFCIDDVDATASSGSVQASQFIKFFSEHKSWLHGDTVTEYKNQVQSYKRFDYVATEKSNGGKLLPELGLELRNSNLFPGDCHHQDKWPR